MGALLQGLLGLGEGGGQRGQPIDYNRRHMCLYSIIPLEREVIPFSSLGGCSTIEESVDKASDDHDRDLPISVIPGQAIHMAGFPWVRHHRVEGGKGENYEWP
jgi:hypothetical protein